MTQLPVVRLAVVCDQVERIDNAWVLRDPLHTMQVPQGMVLTPNLPIQFRLHYYMQMTDGEGEFPIHVRVFNEGSQSEQAQSPIYSTPEQVVTCDDRLEVIELAFEFPTFRVGVPGLYLFQAFCNQDKLEGVEGVFRVLQDD